MKKLFTIIVLLSFVLFSCSEPETDIAGTYLGQVEVYFQAGRESTERTDEFQINVIKSEAGYVIEHFPQVFSTEESIKLTRVSRYEYAMRDESGSGKIRFIVEPYTKSFVGDFFRGGGLASMTYKLKAQEIYVPDSKPD